MRFKKRTHALSRLRGACNRSSPSLRSRWAFQGVAQGVAESGGRLDKKTRHIVGAEAKASQGDTTGVSVAFGRVGCSKLRREIQPKE